MRNRFGDWIGASWERVAERLPRARSQGPSEEMVSEICQALHTPANVVGPADGFREQLGERLSMAARSRLSGVSVQERIEYERLLLITSALAIALTVTGLALAVRRLAR